MVDEIKKALDTGLVDGITTNPSHIAATGRAFEDVVEDILKVFDGPLSVEVVGSDARQMLAEACALRKLSPNVVIKVPATVDGISAMSLMKNEGIPVNATLIFSPLQALLVAKVDALYASVFVGRLEESGENGMEVLSQIRRIYNNYSFKTQILAAAVRSVEHVFQAALVGADVITIRYSILEQLADHPLTEMGLSRFMEDWKSVPHRSPR
jgi:transaldolase